ncbi:MAG: hypothetical protein ACNS63_03975 [Candidatus Nitrospinota bacterium M3_3B_026]
MVDKWLRLSNRVTTFWYEPILIAANTRLSIDVTRLGNSITVKLNILPHIIKRLNDELNEFFGYAREHKSVHIFKKGMEGRKFPDPNYEKAEEVSNLKYKLIADIDSLLFELESLCELMEEIFVKLYEHAGERITPKKAGKKVAKVIKDSGQEIEWFKKLNDHRNLFIHETAPVLAIDVSDSNRYDLLIMKENTTKFDFDDDSKFIKLSDLNNIVSGFLKAESTLQKHLISLFETQ